MATHESAEDRYVLDLEGADALAFRAAFLIVGAKKVATTREQEERYRQWEAVVPGVVPHYAGQTDDFIETAAMLTEFTTISEKDEDTPIDIRPGDIGELIPLLPYRKQLGKVAAAMAEDIRGDLTAYITNDGASLDAGLDELLSTGWEEAA